VPLLDSDPVAVEDLKPGCGAVVQLGLHKAAVYRDEQGGVHKRSGKPSLLQYSAVHYNKVLYNSVQYSTVDQEQAKGRIAPLCTPPCSSRYTVAL